MTPMFLNPDIAVEVKNRIAKEEKR